MGKIARELKGIGKVALDTNCIIYLWRNSPCLFFSHML